LTPRVRDLNFDHVSSAAINPAASRSVRILIACLLTSTFALTLHLQAARYQQPLEFAGAHILHGDLRPDADSSAKAPRLLAHPMVAMVLWIAILAITAPRAASDISFEDPFRSRFLRYLRVLLRAPPQLCVIG
jgi:hypothetical protein